MVISPDFQLLLQALVLFADVIHDYCLLASITIPPLVAQFWVVVGVGQSRRPGFSYSRISVYQTPLVTGDGGGRTMWSLAMDFSLW